MSERSVHSVLSMGLLYIYIGVCLLYTYVCIYNAVVADESVGLPQVSQLPYFILICCFGLVYISVEITGRCVFPNQSKQKCIVFLVLMATVLVFGLILGCGLGTLIITNFVSLWQWGGIHLNLLHLRL